MVAQGDDKPNNFDLVLAGVPQGYVLGPFFMLL